MVRNINWVSSSAGTFSMVNWMVVSFSMWKADKINTLLVVTQAINK